MIQFLRKVLGIDVRFKRNKMVVVDLETLDTRPTSLFYAVGARMFTFGKDIDNDSVLDADDPKFILEHDSFLQYVSLDLLQDIRFTTSAETVEWTEQKNIVEYNRAKKHGRPLVEVVKNFDAWINYHQPKSIVANSPAFDISIMRHAYGILERKFPMHFRDEFDARTITTLRHLCGMSRYAKIESQRLHSPLDDCTLSIKAIHEFVVHMETCRFK